MTWAEPTEPTSCPLYKLIRNQLLRADQIEQGHHSPLAVLQRNDCTDFAIDCVWLRSARMRPAPHFICDELAAPEDARHRPARSPGSKVAGLDAYNSSKEKLGSINQLLINKSGNIRAAVLKRRRPPASARTTSPCR